MEGVNHRVNGKKKTELSGFRPVALTLVVMTALPKGQLPHLNV